MLKYLLRLMMGFYPLPIGIRLPFAPPRSFESLPDGNEKNPTEHFYARFTFDSPESFFSEKTMCL
jgi:hypothetical protein